MKQLIAILGTFCALTTLSAEVKVATQPLTYKVDQYTAKNEFFVELIEIAVHRRCNEVQFF